MVRAKADTRNTLFNGKEYKDGIDDLAKKTVVRASDLDDKAIKFLDYLQQNGGRGKEACQYLKQALEGLSREHVSNWRAYVYTILRGFDKHAYEAMKNEDGKRARPPRGPRAEKPLQEKKDKFPLSSFVFNPMAAEFIPGQIWPLTEAAAVPLTEAAAVPLTEAAAVPGTVVEAENAEPAETAATPPVTDAETAAKEEATTEASPADGEAAPDAPEAAAKADEEAQEEKS